MLADAGPPALYGVLTTPLAMPSTEITLHFAAVETTSPGPWVLGRFQTTYAASGYAVEDGELWGEDRRLVLHSRQLRRIVQRP